MTKGEEIWEFQATMTNRPIMDQPVQKFLLYLCLPKEFFLDFLQTAITCLKGADLGFENIKILKNGLFLDLREWRPFESAPRHQASSGDVLEQFNQTDQVGLQLSKLSFLILRFDLFLLALLVFEQHFGEIKGTFCTLAPEYSDMDK